MIMKMSKKNDSSAPSASSVSTVLLNRHFHACEQKVVTGAKRGRPFESVVKSFCMLPQVGGEGSTRREGSDIFTGVRRERSSKVLMGITVTGRHTCEISYCPLLTHL